MPGSSANDRRMRSVERASMVRLVSRRSSSRNSSTISIGLKPLLARRSSVSRATKASASMSASIWSAASGRSSLTTTSDPSFQTAECTCAMLAAASGSGSIHWKSSSVRPFSWSSSAARTRSKGIFGQSACSLANSSASESGIRSRRVERICPILMNVGPSSSIALRRRSSKGAEERSIVPSRLYSQSALALRSGAKPALATKLAKP